MLSAAGRMLPRPMTGQRDDGARRAAEHGAVACLIRPAGFGQNTYRGLVRIAQRAAGARNHTQCDSLLIGKDCGAHTFPYMEIKNPGARVEHEATTSKISANQLFYCRQRGISEEDAVNLIVNGFCKEVFKELPMEFAVEAQALLSVSLEGSVG